MLKLQLKSPFKSAFLSWIFLLLGMFLINWHDGGYNAFSRFAEVQSISEHHSFDLGRFQDWTIDWAKTPDGHVYSNKAPGPILLAVPVAWVLNRMKVLVYGERAWFTYSDGARELTQPGLAYLTLIAWLFQLLPYVFVCFLGLQRFERAGFSYAACNFSAVALLFGNTLSILLGMYLGHPVAGWSLLAVFLCLEDRRFSWAGFFFGVSALSDYGTFFVAPAFLGAVWIVAKSSEKKAFYRIILGGLAPAAVFAAYHTACFGKPWALPMQFQNPLFVDGASSARVWGVARLFPDPDVFLKLCFGMQRGILWTQPWVFVVGVGVLFLFRRAQLSRLESALSLFAFGGLIGLLWMNAGFNGWHGGGSPGPRYLSIIFPCVAFLGGILYDRLSIPLRRALWITLAYSAVFRMVVYSMTPLPDAEFGLWSYYWNFFFTKPHPALRVFTLVAGLGLMAAVSLRVWRMRPVRSF